MSIRTYGDFEALRENGEFTSAEERLIKDCQAGELIILGDGTLPTGPSDDRTVKAKVLRYLILGGCDACRVDDIGVRLKGAWVEGHLDLSFATARGATQLENCVFTELLTARLARFEDIDLEGCRLLGLNAQSCTVVGNIWMDGLTSVGEVTLVSARIGGQLSLKGAKLEGGEGYALIAQGASVSGGIYLDQTQVSGGLSFADAEISGGISCIDAELNGGEGKALNAQGASVIGGIFVRSLRAFGEVSVCSARIEGAISCESADLTNVAGFSLNAQGAIITRGVLLSGVATKGEVSFSGAEIKVQMVFSNIKFDGCGGIALNAQRLQLNGGFVWRDVTSVVGRVILDAAYISDFVDDHESWEAVQSFSVIGLTYDNLLGPLDVNKRLIWLGKGAKFDGDFHPQPYQHLAKVLRESGHRAEARQILIAKEQDQKRAVRRRLRRERRFRRNLRRFSARPTEASRDAVNEAASLVEDLANTLAPFFRRRHGDTNLTSDPYERLWAQVDFRNQMLCKNAGTLVRIALSHAGDRPFRWLAGYGLSPLRSVWAMVALIAMLFGVAHFTWVAGDFAPKSDVVIVSEGWASVANEPLGLAINAAEIWSSESSPGRDYETFNALAYAIDVVLPIVDLGQERAWSPSPARGWWGWGAFYAQKGFVLLGWVVAAIFAAAVTGIIRRDD